MLLTGPAGSGKTTTIYACLRNLAEQSGRHVITILGMMSLYVATNLRTLAILKRDIQLIEKKQVQHWSKMSAQ